MHPDVILKSKFASGVSENHPNLIDLGSQASMAFISIGDENFSELGIQNHETLEKGKMDVGGNFPALEEIFSNLKAIPHELNAKTRIHAYSKDTSKTSSSNRVDINLKRSHGWGLSSCSSTLFPHCCSIFGISSPGGLLQCIDCGPVGSKQDTGYKLTCLYVGFTPPKFEGASLCLSAVEGGMQANLACKSVRIPLVNDRLILFRSRKFHYKVQPSSSGARLHGESSPDSRMYLCCMWIHGANDDFDISPKSC